MVNFQDFLNLKDILSVLVGGIVDLPNITLTREEFPVGDENLLKEKGIGARVSCVLDVHSKHMLTLKNCLKKENSQKNKNQKFGFKFYSTGYIPHCCQPLFNL